MKKLILAGLLSTSALTANASDYIIDTKGAHASINFKVNHMGFSWLTGRFNTFSGQFNYDPKNISDTKINVKIDTSSVDSNHAERDKHIRSDDFLSVKEFAEATFVSSSVIEKENGKLEVMGLLTLQGIKTEITIDAFKVGEGKDPWGNYRVGFSGNTKISMKNYGYKMDFGDVIFNLNIEGIRQ
jgi:polyisoprenoid-binding protein YceI